MIKDLDFYLLNAFFKAIHSVTFYCPTVPDAEGVGGFGLETAYKNTFHRLVFYIHTLCA